MERKYQRKTMVYLQEISSIDLSSQEKSSILQHAIDLHLLGSDEVNDPGFDIVEKGSSRVKHLFRINSNGKNVGVLYLFSFNEVNNQFEITILVHQEFRGKHIAGEAMKVLESFVLEKYRKPIHLFASVREHNPLRKELTTLLIRYGYKYSSELQAFTKQLS